LSIATTVPPLSQVLLADEATLEEAEEAEVAVAGLSTKPKTKARGRKPKAKDDGTPKPPRPKKRKHDDPSRSETVCLSHLDPLLKIDTYSRSYQILLNLRSFKHSGVDVDLTVDSSDDLPPLTQISTLANVSYAASVVSAINADSRSSSGRPPAGSLNKSILPQIEQGSFFFSYF
jgi:hypothetical protein